MQQWHEQEIKDNLGAFRIVHIPTRNVNRPKTDLSFATAMIEPIPGHSFPRQFCPLILDSHQYIVKFD